MSNQIEKLSFDYSNFPKNVSSQLIESSIIIRESMKRTGQEIVLIGLELLKSKELIEHGQFENWCQIEFQLSKQMANNFMNVAKVYGKSKIILLFKPTILYELAAPSTPEEVRQIAEQKVQHGENVTVKEIKELKKQLKQKNDHIKELTESKERDLQNFKQSLQEIDQEKDKIIKDQSDQIEQLSKKIYALESQSPYAIPSTVPEAQPDSDKSSEFEKLKNQIRDRDQEIVKLSRDLKQLQDKYSQGYIENEARTKARYETQIKELKSEIERLKNLPELIYEPEDSEMDINILSLIKFFDNMEDNNIFVNEQLIYRFQQLHEKLELFFDKINFDPYPS